MSTQLTDYSRERVGRAIHGRPLRRRDVTIHELDGEGLIFDARTTDTHRLNETALCIWHACDGTRNVQQIAELLTEQFDVEMDEAHAHVEQFLATLQDAGLVAPSNLSTDERAVP